MAIIGGLGTFSPDLGAAEQYYNSISAQKVQPVQPQKRGPNRVITFWASMNQRGACGVVDIFDFQQINLMLSSEERAKSYIDYYENKDNVSKNSGGCGWLSAAFIDTGECKAVYQKLRNWYPIVYQSPIRFNTNSGNNFFFCIFDTGEKEMPERFTEDGEEHTPEEERGFYNGLDW